ncbi:MAG: hypothetical protein CL840_21960 [Crocinitomicaceae bacterium]|nr:hypothetical protein [Crocinitomicaceae bacterium]|tara:strand:+ start:10654 stop:11424 length:771 start_codon:yes stop_codon:yes gene_type:complete
MKKYYIVWVFTIIVTGLIAQDNPGAGDVDLDDKEKIEFYDSYDEFRNRKNKHWQGFDIGINGLMYEDGTDVPPGGYEYLQLDYGRSFYFGLNLFEVDFQINGELIKVVTGLGFDFNNFQLRSNSYMYSRNDSMIEVRDSVWNFCNNNMKNAHITVPLLLAFNTSPKNSTSYHIAFGVIGSYRLSGKQKVVYINGNLKNEILRKSPMHQNPWQVHATLRLGYGNFHIFGNLGLIDYWESGAAPSAKVWTMGIKVLPW